MITAVDYQTLAKTRRDLNLGVVRHIGHDVSRIAFYDPTFDPRHVIVYENGSVQKILVDVNEFAETLLVSEQHVKFLELPQETQEVVVEVAYEAGEKPHRIALDMSTGRRPYSSDMETFNWFGLTLTVGASEYNILLQPERRIRH